MVTAPIVGTCPGWCQRHEADPTTSPEDVDHIRVVADDLTVGDGRFERPLEVRLVQQSSEGWPAFILLDAETYTADQARRLAAALLAAADLLDQA